MAEIIFALGILAVITLALLTLFTKLPGSQSKTGRDAVARALADSVLEQAVLDGPPFWGVPDPSVRKPEIS